jgi:hypothetical protein
MNGIFSTEEFAFADRVVRLVIVRNHDTGIIAAVFRAGLSCEIPRMMEVLESRFFDAAYFLMLA